MFDSTHYGMGSTTKALTWRTSRPVGATTSGLGIVATNSTNNRTINDLGAATNSCLTPPNDQEVMKKAMARPRHTGRLGKHHRVHSATMTDTVAPRHTMP